MWRGRLVSWSFWLIVVIHLAVFTSIGIFTERGWSLLIMFVCGVGATQILFRLVRLYAKRHPDKRLARWALWRRKKE